MIEPESAHHLIFARLDPIADTDLELANPNASNRISNRRRSHCHYTVAHYTLDDKIDEKFNDIFFFDSKNEC